MMLPNVNMAKEGGIIQRLNYGVIFKSMGMIDTAEQAWKHTIQIQISSFNMDNMFPETKCQHNSSEYSQLMDMLQHINKIKSDTYERVNNISNVIYQLIHTTKHAHFPARDRRAILDFIGDLSKQLFDTARVKDLEVLAQHVAAMADQTGQLQHAFQQHSSGME